MNILEKINLDSSWDFKNANTKLSTHCYHNYPAMMIPQIAERLIIQYGQNARTLFDPYCGTGTSLVEANIKNINAIGTDLNPLARLIAKTKTVKIELSILDLYLQEFNDFLLFVNFGLNKPNISLPKFKNIDFWFGKDIQEKLALIKYFIENIKEPNVKNFFYIAFSETVRESSFTRNSEFKLYRMSEKQRKIFNPDVFSIIISKLTRNRQGLIDYLEKTKNINPQTQIWDFNTVETTNHIPQNFIDIIVTSPPYGDSKTTVAYGQFSCLANQWLGVENAKDIDNTLMGGQGTNNIQKIGINLVDEIIEKIADQDLKRAKEVYSFYRDYQKSINNVSTTLKRGGYACYVVGNRRVKGITLPTDQITRAFFEANGFKHENTFRRNIPNKRMPKKNSPTNEVGKTATTMNHEYIVVLKKIA
jgi:DNA modification methylase